MQQTAGTIARQPSEITHLSALKCGDVWDILLVHAEGDNLEEVLESPAAVELLHAQPCMTQLDLTSISLGTLWGLHSLHQHTHRAQCAGTCRWWSA